MSDFTKHLLLDTDVMIDLIRQRPPALNWLRSLPDFPVVSCFTALELLGGSKDKHEYRVSERLLMNFPILYPMREDLERGITDYTPFCLSHGVGFLDILIASVAVGHDFTLATFNAKHFGNLPNLRTVQPYTR
ncbi:MAG: PIN domain-containing protein [Armatimonadetes bacterium]|nr:PIN domain-containing protein [Armatimonadota bacterium]